MTSFFKRALDAYRILTGKDDAVQKGIMQLQKEIAQREARRAVQQAALEKQILDELRQSSEALRNIKDGYVAQEEQIAKFAAALGESAHAQLAAQAEAEAQMFLETARRSGIQLEAPPPFSEFVKRANLGLASGEAVTAMLGSRGVEGTYGEVDRAEIEQAEIEDAVREAEDSRVDLGANQSGGHSAGQMEFQEGADGKVQKSFSDPGPNISQAPDEGVDQTEPAAKAEASHEELLVHEQGRFATAGGKRAVPLSTVKVDSESSSDSDSDSDEELQTKLRLVSADPEKEVTELGGAETGGQEGEHAVTVEVEVSERPAETVQGNGTRSAGAERRAASDGSKLWGEAVESVETKMGQEKSREGLSSFIELPSQASSDPGSVVGASGGVLETADGTQEGIATRLADGNEQALPPLENDVLRSGGKVEDESRSGKPKNGESTRKRSGKKREEAEAKAEKGAQAPKARKKRAPGKKKAEL